MSAYPTRRITQALEKKGFTKDDTHHRMFWLMVEGRRRGIRTFVSHSIREYGDRLLAAMAKEMKLRRAELDAFIQCPMGQEDYLALLRERSELR
jgi:hypothetical protein